MPDAKGSRRKRALMPIAREQISVLIDGRSVVEAYTKRRLLHDLVIRHPQVLIEACPVGELVTDCRQIVIKSRFVATPNPTGMGN